MCHIKRHHLGRYLIRYLVLLIEPFAVKRRLNSKLAQLTEFAALLSDQVVLKKAANAACSNNAGLAEWYTQ